MVTAEEASRVLREWILAHPRHDGVELVPVGQPQEHRLYWTLTAQSRAFVEQGDVGQALAGSSGFAVPKDGRAPFWLPGARPAGHWIQVIERREILGDPPPRPGGDTEAARLRSALGEWAGRLRLVSGPPAPGALLRWSDGRLETRVVNAGGGVIEVMSGDVGSPHVDASFRRISDAQRWVLAGFVMAWASRRGVDVLTADVVDDPEHVDGGHRVDNAGEAPAWFRHRSDATTWARLASLSAEQIGMLPWGDDIGSTRS